MKADDFVVICGYGDIWSVWFIGTVVIARGGDPWVFSGSNIQSETPSRYPLTRDSI